MSKYSTGSITEFITKEPVISNGYTPIPVTGVPGYLSQWSPFTLRLNLPEYTKITPPAAGEPVKLNSISAANTEVRTKIDANSQKAARKLVSTLAGVYNSNAKQKIPVAGSKDALNDQKTLLDIIYQRAQIIANSEVTLLINPNSFSVSHNKIQNHDQTTRSGTVFQSLLGDNYIQIQCNGKIGAYTVYKPHKPGESSSPDGTGYFAKVNSANYLNFLELLNLFLNNGTIYDTYGKSRANLQVGSVSIIYDGWEYIGNFDSFNYNYADTNQNGGLEWDFSFQASSMFAVDNS